MGHDREGVRLPTRITTLIGTAEHMAGCNSSARGECVSDKRVEAAGPPDEEP
jgi:hypothetical protein